MVNVDMQLLASCRPHGSRLPAEFPDAERYNAAVAAAIRQTKVSIAASVALIAGGTILSLSGVVFDRGIGAFVIGVVPVMIGFGWGATAGGIADRLAQVDPERVLDFVEAPSADDDGRRLLLSLYERQGFVTRGQLKAVERLCAKADADFAHLARERRRDGAAAELRRLAQDCSKP